MIGALLGLGGRAALRDPLRLVPLALGVAAAALVCLVELALWAGVTDAHMGPLAQVRPDLIVLHARRQHLNRLDDLEPASLQRVAAVPGVHQAAGLWQEVLHMQPQLRAPQRRIAALGIDPAIADGGVGLAPETVQALRQPLAVAFDVGSRDIFGRPAIGDDIWVQGQRMRVAAHVRMGPSLVNDGNLVMSIGNLAWLGRSPHPAAALVRVSPGEEVSRVGERIAQSLGAGVSVMTPEQLRRREGRYLARVAPVGLLFAVGAVAGGAAAALLTYQILYVQAVRQRRAIATMMAMGAGRARLSAWLMPRALLAIVLGFLVGWAAAEAVCALVRWLLAMPVVLSGPALAIAFAGAVLLAPAAAFLVLRRLPADPAELLY